MGGGGGMIYFVTPYEWVPDPASASCRGLIGRPSGGEWGPDTTSDGFVPICLRLHVSEASVRLMYVKRA